VVGAVAGGFHRVLPACSIRVHVIFRVHHAEFV
jgi:hypothetical protein